MTKHGGQLAGLHLGRPPTSIDAAQLPPAAGKKLAALVGAVKAETGSAQAPHEPRPDEMSYTITIEDGMQRIVLKQSDTSMTSAFQDLLDWIENERLH